ncbi:hypothetical protein N7504_000321 [Penicillium tannophilum]|nr:hypothetical protein N7504_000321 [Penicillium tannophilum]
MKKLNEGLRLLNLTPSVAESGDGAGNESSDGLGLWDVEKRLFKDNESARAVLVELEIDALTEAEARSVLGHRVEVGS